jgi:small subunit ribosomal protein S13
MIRIAGVNIPEDKKIWFGLTKIYGIGRTSAFKILEKAGVSPEKRGYELTEEEITAIRKIVESEYKVEGELRKEIQLNIKRLIDLGTYRGLRHLRGLPVRGQRTRSNARTRKGPKRRILSSKKKKEAKAAKEAKKE